MSTRIVGLTDGIAAKDAVATDQLERLPFLSGRIAGTTITTGVGYSLAPATADIMVDGAGWVVGPTGGLLPTVSPWAYALVLLNISTLTWAGGAGFCTFKLQYLATPGSGGWSDLIQDQVTSGTTGLVEFQGSALAIAKRSELRLLVTPDHTIAETIDVNWTIYLSEQQL